MDRFIAACAGEDLEGLARTLHPDVRGWATFDDETVGYANGIDACAVRAVFFFGPRSGSILTPLPLDDGVAVLATRNGEPVALMRFELAEGLVHSMHTVLLPASLPQASDR